MKRRKQAEIRDVAVERGTFRWVGPKGLTSGSFKAYYRDDPDGFYGYGTTETDAKKMLEVYGGTEK